MLIFSCDAPRDNILDPNNSDNQIFTIQGRVITTRIPATGLNNVSIYFQNANLYTNTDKNGYFKIVAVSLKDGWLYFDKSGYFSDSIFVEWGSDKTKNLLSNLNSIQLISDLSFYSITINRIGTEPIYRIGIKLQIIDEENDADSIFLTNNELKFSKLLNYNSSQSQYESIFNLNELGIKPVGDLIGKDFIIRVKDKYLRDFNIGTASIKRIIYQVIQLREPIDYQVVPPTQLFKWTRFEPGFQFYYKIEIYTNEVNPELVHEVDNIPSNEIQYQSTKTLDSGEYFWVMWCIDEFGNQSQSKPASFVVQ